MGDKSKYHHLIPQTYISAWGNASGTIAYKDLKTGVCDERNKDNILGINHYHSIIAGMPICTEDDVKEIFAVLRDYNVEYQGTVITDLMKINQVYYDFENWKITRKSDGTIASKKPIKSAIDQVKIRDIETLWSKKYENYWPDVRTEIENKILTANGEIEEFQKDFLMRFYVLIDWRSSATDPIFAKEFKWISNDVLQLDQFEIPECERELPSFKTMADYFEHCLLLKMFRRFLNDEGPMFVHLEASKKNTSFHFLIADGNSRFITSDNPSFTCWRQDNLKVGLMPITPRILMAQGKADNADGLFHVTHITEQAVEKYNRMIEENALQYIIFDNTGK